VGDEQLPTPLIAVHHEDDPLSDRVVHRPSVGPTRTPDNEPQNVDDCRVQ
jgi:hypothetical protein